MGDGGSGEQLVVPRRFNGPPESGNGGFTCGLAAALLEARAAEVHLRSPPPLDTPLRSERDGGAVRLLASGQLVADASPLEAVDVDLPQPVAPPVAHDASARYPWYEEHPFPTCFVCGPRRPDRDGLSIFAGQVAGRDLYACDWTPASEWDRGDGLVRDEIVWAALDCPSAVAAAAGLETGPRPAVLARLAASTDDAPAVGEQHAVISWPIGIDGRKRHAGSAILDSEGRVRAHARALWIELRG
jgi:hypothetical protein